MSVTNPGEFLYPRHCRVGVSPDKKQLALTFSSEDRAPLTVVLPVLGAASFQRNLAQCLYLLGVRPVTNQTAGKDVPPAADAQPEPAEVQPETQPLALDQA
jgi:hypothetical protein